MRSALESIEGVESVSITLPDSVLVKGSASNETLITAINAAAGGRYQATAR